VLVEEGFRNESPPLAAEVVDHNFLRCDFATRQRSMCDIAEGAPLSTVNHEPSG
jgi:hypothetical protein